MLDLHPPSPPGFPPLLARLVDDAALFPPSAASVVDTVKAHLAARRAPYAAMIGFLLCPISQFGALVSALRKARPARPVALSLVADTGLGGLPKAISTALDNAKLLDLRMIEVPAPSDVDSNWLVQLTEFVPDDVVRVVEPRRGRPEWLTGVRRVAEAGCWPKLRCGGKSVESFPSVEEVVDFLAIATGTGQPFKATAGLQHAVRHYDEGTGLTHHGLLNMLVGTARAVSGSGAHEALRSTDAAALAAEAAAFSADTSRVVRRIFACYGAVSLSDPVAELVRLGLLPAATPRRAAQG